ncbi:MAG: hypothetical protein AAB268_11820 [Elusimicrobiota bacterium]
MGDAITTATGSRSPFNIYADFTAAAVVKTGPSGFSDDGASQLPDAAQVARSTQTDANAHSFTLPSTPIDHLSSRYVTVAQPSLLDRPSALLTTTNVPGPVDFHGILLPVSSTGTVLPVNVEISTNSFGITRSSPSPSEIQEAVMAFANVSPSRDLAIKSFTSRIAAGFHDAFTPDPSNGTTRTVENELSSSTVQRGTVLELRAALSTPVDAGGVTADFSGIDTAFVPANVSVSAPNVTSTGTFYTIRYPLSYGTSASSGSVQIAATTTLARTNGFSATDNSFALMLGGPWNYLYDAGFLPDAITPASFAWEKIITGRISGLVTEILSGLLHISFPKGGTFNYTRMADPDLAATNLTIDFRMETRVGAPSSLGGGENAHIFFRNNQRFGAVFIHADRVSMVNGANAPQMFFITPGVPHTYRLTRDGNTMQLYIDGAAALSMATPFFPTFPTDSTLFFGAQVPPGSAYDGIWEYVAYTPGLFAPGDLPSPAVASYSGAPIPFTSISPLAVASSDASESISQPKTAWSIWMDQMLAQMRNTPAQYMNGPAAKRAQSHITTSGGQVKRFDRMSVNIPAGALAQALDITVSTPTNNSDTAQRKDKRTDRSLSAASDEVEYGPEGTRFDKPVTLTLAYDPILIAARGMDEDNIKVHYWNALAGDWEALASTVDKQAKTVSAETTHFSIYQAMGAAGGIGVAAIDDIGLRDGYAFPNPSQSGSAVTFRMQPGSVDSIEVRVYDVSGRKIHSSSAFRFLGAIDDGNGKGVQNTYDHTWDVSGVGSGVYTFVMTAKKAGQKDVRKTGKVGVIK